MEITITYSLSQDGQREALRRGLDARAEQVLHGEVGAEALDLDAVQVSEDGKAEVTWTHYRARALRLLDAPLASVEEALDVLRRRQQEEAAEEESARQREAEEHEERVAEALRQGYTYFVDDSRDQVRYDLLRDERIDHLLEEARAELQRRRREAEAAEEAAEQRRRAQLAEAVDLYGSDSQRERWEAGVLPHREAVDLIYAEAVRPLLDAGLTVEDGTRYHCSGDTRSENTISRLSTEEWSLARVVPLCVPRGTQISYWRQRGESEGEYGECVRHERVLARCEWRVGEIEVCADVILRERRTTDGE